MHDRTVTRALFLSTRFDKICQIWDFEISEKTRNGIWEFFFAEEWQFHFQFHNFNFTQTFDGSEPVDCATNSTVERKSSRSFNTHEPKIPAIQNKIGRGIIWVDGWVPSVSIFWFLRLSCLFSANTDRFETNHDHFNHNRRGKNKQALPRYSNSIGNQLKNDLFLNRSSIVNQSINKTPPYFFLLAACVRGLNGHTLDPLRPPTDRPRGDVSSPYRNRDAQRNHNIHLQFCKVSARASFVSPAKTVRPREKSFIRPISRFWNPAENR